MAGNRLRRRRRDERPTSIELLLDDPETIRAANEAFALAERPDLAAWPFVASVGAETVALRWAGGTSIPEPAAPWRAGGDARVWVAERSDLAESDAVAKSGNGGTAVLVGWFDETLVCVNASRAPGPIAVDGDDEAAELLRELIARQTPVQPRTPPDGPGAWWPMEARENVIQLIGLAVARTFAVEESQQALELVRLASALDLSRQHELEAAGARRGQTETRPEDALELWLDQVRAAAAQVSVEARQRRRAVVAEAPVDTVADVEVVEVEVEDVADFAFSASATDDSEPGYAPEPVPSSGPSPIPADDDLDDWAAGFAVSSAE
jgi:hypothetical protein